jgi:hypothetical protein
MKQLALLICLMLGFSLGATTWIVKQDGSGHFTQIQAAINASAHTDSIKVFPGTYVENIDYSGKNIFIYSLEYTTGNSAYRDSTIIDGNQSGSVVKSVTATTNCGIYGFTITNGSGSPLTYYQGVLINLGGGVALISAIQFKVDNCNIENNRAIWGGGIWLYQSTLYLSDSIVSQNYATAGGGINISYYGQVVFDQINRSSVYNNIAGVVQDIIAADSRLDTNVYLDMGSVSPTTDYYVFYQKSFYDWPGSFPVVDIQRAYRGEVNQDLFVSPQGNDENDGLSNMSPFKSIYKALQYIASDSLNLKVIHLASGIYSSSDDQFFPIGMKPFVRLVGDPESFPILENLYFRETIVGGRSHGSQIENIICDFGDNHNGAVAVGAGGARNVFIKNVTINPLNTVSYAGMSFGTNNELPASYTLENVKIFGQNSPFQAGFYSYMPDAMISNLTIENCNVTGGELENPTSIFYYHGNKLQMHNSQLTNNSISYNGPNILCVGSDGNQSTRELKLDNVLIANNQTAGAPPVFIAAFNDNPAIINNCTFANNSGSTYAVQLNGNFVVNNSIFDNDTTREIRSAGSTSQIQFNNNFIRNYPASTSFEAFNNVSFNGVVLTGDPGFCSSVASDPLSYRLSNSSICRDMGDATGLELPETDLAGNPRIYGAAVDLGCYEWNYPVSVGDELSPAAVQLSTFPNPFTEQLTLLFNTKQQGRISCEFYNIKGQKVRSLTDMHYSSGDHMLVWDGCDNSGMKLGSGIYFMRMQLDGKVIATRKMIMAK